MAKKEKYRLDKLIAGRFPEFSRNQIQSLVIQGKVTVDGVVITKPGTQVVADVVVEVNAQEPRYVSRAGLKLEKALEHFNIDVLGLTVLDAGISTGGFTDCLLQHGAKKVYGVDVGYGQVHEKIRADKRVVLLERTNLRKLKLALAGEQVRQVVRPECRARSFDTPAYAKASSGTPAVAQGLWPARQDDRARRIEGFERECKVTFIPERVDLVTLDLSFISILKVLPAVSTLLKPGGQIITLIKPQFEAERKDIRRGGVVKDESVYPGVLAKIEAGMKEYRFEMIGEPIESPILGAKSGNKEFLAVFKRTKK